MQPFLNVRRVADLRRIQVLCANRALTVHATVSALEEVLIRNK